MSEQSAQLDQVVHAILASASYRMISRDLVVRIAAAELGKRRNMKEAIKATKNTLHQVAGAYVRGAPRFDEWLVEIQAAQAGGDRRRLLDSCARAMSYHSSTRERLPILDRFFAETLAACGPIRSVLDLACGLNPLAIPWMPLAPGATYLAYDIYSDMMDFVGAFLATIGVEGQAHACDILHAPPAQAADVAFLLKAIPCLGQMDKSAGLRLLDAVNARYVLVSFPVSSLTGKGKGMRMNYEAHFGELMSERRWPFKRFEFSAELAFVVTKASVAPFKER